MPRLFNVALLATCLTALAFPHAVPLHGGSASGLLWRGGASAPPTKAARSAFLAAAGRREGPRPEASSHWSEVQKASASTARAHQAPTASATGSPPAQAEIRSFFDRYLRLHESKDMTAWPKLFLDGAAIVRTGSDGRVLRYSPADLAARIAAEATKLESQHETFEDIRIEVEGDAAMYSTHWKLFHDGQQVREGRAWFSLVRSETRWRIAALVWYNR